MNRGRRKNRSRNKRKKERNKQNNTNNKTPTDNSTSTAPAKEAVINRCKRKFNSKLYGTCEFHSSDVVAFVFVVFLFVFGLCVVPPSFVPNGNVDCLQRQTGETIRAGFSKLYLDPTWSDLTLVVGDKKLPVHKMVCTHPYRYNASTYIYNTYTHLRREGGKAVSREERRRRKRKGRRGKREIWSI